MYSTQWCFGTSMRNSDQDLATKYFDELMVVFICEEHPLRGSPLGQDPSILAKCDLGLAYLGGDRWTNGVHE